jgi:hypothetical protein
MCDTATNQLFVGISQNDAVVGETVGLITSGLSTFRFYSNGFDRGENIYITNPELLGTTCIPREENPIYLRKGISVYLGRIIPTPYYEMGIVTYATAWIKSD